jgi:HK97 family phage portal protein
MPTEFGPAARPSRKRRRRKRRSLENPNVPLNVADPDDFTLEAFGAGRSQSGVRVNRKRALGYPAVWRAVSLISGDVAKLPLAVYTQHGRNREPAKDHPAYRLLLRKPNDAMTAFVFKQTLLAHVLLNGNGYAYIDRDGASRPMAMLSLIPECVDPVRRDGRLWYLYRTPDTGELRKLPAEDVLHLRGLGYDGLKGYPVLHVHADSIGAALAARDFSARYFRNNARPGGAIKHPKTLSPRPGPTSGRAGSGFTPA